MRALASRLSTFLCRRSPGGHVQSRNFSSHNAKAKDELTIEQIMKYSFAVMATVVGYQFFPYLGLGDDYVIRKAVSGLKSKCYKCLGAGILARYATDDKRRIKIVEIGGAQELVNMLRDARDDNKQQAALKALAAISGSA